ncbi:MAG: murein biosynthesis integral membrane protein MurJ [Clostridia bacterium]
MANAYILVVFGILCAKAAGFLRDAVFASTFGTGTASDIYFQIFGVASLIFTAVGSALSTLIIKNVNKTEHSSCDGQNRYASYFMRNITLLIGGISVVLYIFAEPIVKFLLPNLEGADLALGVKIMYIMLPSFLFISIAYMMSGLLQNRRAFFTPSVMSLPYNVIVIFVLLLGVDDIVKISVITTFGWFLHIVILLPDFYKKGYRFFLKLPENKKGSGMSNSIETILIFISGLMFQICFMFDKMCVSFEEGMITTLSYGSNLFITFSGIFVVAMSSVVFPAISQNYEHGEMDYVRELVRYMMKLMASIFAFYLVAVVFFGDFAVGLIYERGAFTHQDTIKVAIAFGIYSFAIFGYLAQNILNKLFYISGKYTVTVIGALVVATANALIDLILVPYFGVYAAAISTTILLTLYAAFVAVKLKDIIGDYITKELGGKMGKIALCAVISSFTAFVAERFLNHGTLTTILAFCICAAVYVLALHFTGVLGDLFKTPLSKSQK